MWMCSLIQYDGSLQNLYWHNSFIIHNGSQVVFWCHHKYTHALSFSHVLEYLSLHCNQTTSQQVKLKGFVMGIIWLGVGFLVQLYVFILKIPESLKSSSWLCLFEQWSIVHPYLSTFQSSGSLPNSKLSFSFVYFLKSTSYTFINVWFNLTLN